MSHGNSFGKSGPETIQVDSQISSLTESKIPVKPLFTFWENTLFLSCIDHSFLMVTFS